MPQFARRIGRAKPSAIMQVAEKAKRLKAEGRDIISFSIGVPNFLPGEHVYDRSATRWRPIAGSTAATVARTPCSTRSWATSRRSA